MSNYPQTWLVKCTYLLCKHPQNGLEQNKKVVRLGGHVVKTARKDIEKI